MAKSKKANAAPNKLAKPGKTAAAELTETQLDQASGGLIALLNKPVKLLPAV